MPGVEFGKPTAEENLEERKKFVILDVDHRVQLEQRVEIEDGGQT